MVDRSLLMRAASWTPEQKTLATSLAQQILARAPRGRRLVAVDGREGAGAPDLADALQVAFAREDVEAFRASLFDFQQPRVARERQGVDSPVGYFENAFDLELIDRVLLQPFRMGGSTGFMLRAFDAATDQPFEMEWRTAGPDAVLLVDGPFLMRPALAGKWHAIVRVTADERVRGERLRQRSGVHPDTSHPSHRREREAHERYERDIVPERRAHALVDLTDLRRPHQFYADAC